MTKGRLEAFSDAVIAIILTIMVIELHAPHGVDFAALFAMREKFLSYLLSFAMLGIYWNNHHHMFQAAHRVDGRVLWANMHLLFWLSLVPFVTAWMGSSKFAPVPVAAYGAVMAAAGTSYYLLARALAARDGKDSKLARALGRDVKGKASLACYVLAILVAMPWPLVACAIYVLVAVIWLVPDRRFERVLQE